MLFPEEFEIYQQLREINNTIAIKTGDDVTTFQAKYASVHREAVSRGVFDIEARILSILNETGFSPHDADKLVSDFSGGWKMRIGIARIFLQEP